MDASCPRNEERPHVWYSTVSGGYFRALKRDHCISCGFIRFEDRELPDSDKPEAL